MVSAFDVFFQYHLFDFLILIILGLIWLYTTKLNPNHLYVSKGDHRLSYPHYNAGITETQNLIVVIAIPYIVYLVFYLILKYHDPIDYLVPFDFLIIIVGHVGCIFSGNILANCIKIQVGRPRPDYFAVLGQDSGADTLKPDDVPEKEYREEYKSFPSGHSCSAMSGSLYLTLFLNKEIKSQQLWVFILIILPLFYAFYVACTRIIQHRHHIEDVICGLFIGFLFPLLFFSGARNLFIEHIFP